MAIRGVSFAVPAGAIVTILGANGAGKTTILKTVSGVMDPQKGTVTLRGPRDPRARSRTGSPRLGLSHVPEGREVFPFLSVRENLRMGAYTRRDADGVAAGSGDGRTSTSRSCRRAPSSGPARSRAASSRCWRSAGR